MIGRMAPKQLSPLPRLLGGAVAILLTGACWAGAPAGASGPDRAPRAATACPGKVLQETSGGVLDHEVRYHGEGPETEEAFLCSSAGGHPFRIEGPGGSEYSLTYSGLDFAGKQAALEFDYGFGGSVPELWVVDLATGKVSYKKALPEIAMLETPGKPESPRVGRTVLKRDDSVAWTELVPGGTYEVLEHTAHGLKKLDTTHTTRPYSLKLHGLTLSWLEHNGEERTATLH
jgi:hypothetical protein